MLVIEEFKLNENEETFLDIKGKEGGETIELKCSNREFLFKSSSLKGQVNLNIPDSAVTAIKTGFRKPYEYLVMAALAVIVALAIIFAIFGYHYGDNGVSYAIILIALAVAIAFVIAYIKSKVMVLEIYNANFRSNNSIQIAIKKSGELDFDTFERIAVLLNNAVYELNANKK
ncbi:MAG: hypothetical protein LBH25_14180 [Fibromonadaceae bacterium]|jgi:hypothetical protein|nr:hypothetical protein [Fibromonadaceae bacterium]